MAVPTVSTASITNIADTTAQGGGQITDDGGLALTAYGVCWNTTGTPTIADAHTDDLGWSPSDGDSQPGLFTLVTNPTFTNGSSGSWTTYSYKRFVRGSTSQAIIDLTGANRSYILFDHCIIVAGYASYLNSWNCASINHTATYKANHIYFQDCLFLGNYESGTGYSLNRMGFECTGRPAPTGASDIYQDIGLIRCVFQPMGNEAISFDGPEMTTSSFVQDVVILGSGNNPSTSAPFDFGQGFEINGPLGFTVTNLTVHPGRDSGLNLGGADATAADCGWTFTGLDLRSDYDSLQVVQRISGAHPIYAHDMKAASFSGVAARAASGGSSYMTYMTNCDNNNFTGMNWGSGTRYLDGASTGNSGI